MGHGDIGCGPVPVPFARREPDGIAGADFLHRAAFALRPAEAGNHNQGLAEGMGVPGGAGAGFEGDLSALNPLGIKGVEEGIDADLTREPCLGAFRRSPCSCAQYFHWSFS